MNAAAFQISRMLPPIMFAGLLAGCTLLRSPEVVTPETIPPVQTVPPEVPKAIPEAKSNDGFERLWPRLFLSPRELKRTTIKYGVDHLAVTPQEYEDGLIEFKKTFTGKPEDLQSKYEESLHEQLLLLCYLRDVVLKEKPEFEDEARSKLRATLAQLLIEREINSSVRVTEQDVHNEYERNIDQYMQPQRVSVRVILVPTEAEAQTVLNRLRAGEEFSALARQLSMHSSRDSGGQIDPFSRGTYSTNFEDLAFELKTGEVGTLNTSRGVLIMEKIADSAQTVTPFEDVRQQIREKLLDAKRAEARQQFLQQLEERAAQQSENLDESKTLSMESAATPKENSPRAESSDTTQ